MSKKTNNKMVLFVDGHGYVGSLETYLPEKQKTFNIIFGLETYSLDILCIFGIAQGLFVPFKVRALKNDKLIEINTPGYVQKITETDEGLRLFVKTKLSKLVVHSLED